jgi:hypothetical protein
VYARELGQHAQNKMGSLHDPLDEFNIYIVASLKGVLAGFVSITPPGFGSYSVDKYLCRENFPELAGEGLYEVRLLTVTFQPVLVPLLVIFIALPQIVGVDCDWPLRVTPVRVGSAGAVVNATVVAIEGPAISASVASTAAHPSASRGMPVRVTTFGAFDMRAGPSS